MNRWIKDSKIKIKLYSGPDESARNVRRIQTFPKVDNACFSALILGPGVRGSTGKITVFFDFWEVKACQLATDVLELFFSRPN